MGLFSRLVGAFGIYTVAKAFFTAKPAKLGLGETHSDNCPHQEVHETKNDELLEKKIRDEDCEGITMNKCPYCGANWQRGERCRKDCPSRG